MQLNQELLNSILTSSTANLQEETTRWGGGWFTAFNSANRLSLIRVKKAKMSSSASSDLLAQLKAVIQCATVSFFLLETETHFVFFQSRCLLGGLGYFFIMCLWVQQKLFLSSVSISNPMPAELLYPSFGSVVRTISHTLPNSPSTRLPAE